jgi:hypothetical protein
VSDSVDVAAVCCAAVLLCFLLLLLSVLLNPVNLGDELLLVEVAQRLGPNPIYDVYNIMVMIHKHAVMSSFLRQ